MAADRGSPGAKPAGAGFVRLEHTSGATARVALHGAHVVSWTDPEGRERLYLSDRARYGPGDSIRGGIPVVFPQFATGPLPKHGFLRNRRWDLLAHSRSAATFRITDDDQTRALWPYPFTAELNVELSETLAVTLAITNPGSSPFTFTAALHNYFAVDDVERAAVHGLAGLEYVDKVAGNSLHAQETSELVLCDETDRIYVAGPRQVSIEQALGSSATLIGSEGFGDWVVWNPWRDGAKALPDMEPRDYLKMLCVEAARISDPMLLAPGAAWYGKEVLGLT